MIRRQAGFMPARGVLVTMCLAAFAAAPAGAAGSVSAPPTAEIATAAAAELPALSLGLGDPGDVERDAADEAPLESPLATTAQTPSAASLLADGSPPSALPAPQSAARNAAAQADDAPTSPAADAQQPEPTPVPMVVPSLPGVSADDLLRIRQRMNRSDI